jgi:CSLREA domain-containing protein
MTPRTRIRILPRHTARLGTAILLVGMSLSVVPNGVYAANIAVTTTNDELNGDADCSLREAIQAANTDGAVGGCPAGSGADTITVPAGTYRLTLVGAKEDGNATGDLDVLADVTIRGGSLTVVDGNATDRVLHVLAGTALVEDVVFQNGVAPAGASGASCINQSSCDESADGGEDGGGILTEAGSDLTLRRVTVEDNRAGTGGNGGQVNCPTGGADCTTYSGDGGLGGGVAGNGALTIEQSLVARNRSGTAGPVGAVVGCGGSCYTGVGNGGDGGGVIVTGASLDLRTTTVADNESVDWAGGVYCHHGSTCAIHDSTIVDNRAAYRGGGLTGIGTNTTVVNTTITANQATATGGGVSLFSGTMDLDFVTIAGNSTGTIGGGGVELVFGALTMRNSIVADNTNTGATSPDCKGGIVSGGYNHVESLTGCTMALGVGDVAGSDPSLIGLAYNGGGPTETQALAPFSTAVDAIPAGSNGCGSTVAADQRSAVRPMDSDGSGTAACDKGAFELEGPTDCPAAPPACEAAVTSKISLKDVSPDAGKDKLKWSYKGGTVDLTQAQLGDPTSGTVYALCLYYDATLQAAMRLTDPAKWSAVGTTGYKYKDPTGAAGGITAAVLKAGVAGKTSVSFGGKGDNLPDPLPMTPVPPVVTVVARNSSTTTCFSAVYSAAKKNEQSLFQAP